MNVTEISPDWQTLQGTTLEGGYELKDIIEAAENRAVLRVRVLGDYSLKASAIFYVLDDAAADEQIGIWQSIRYFESKSAVSIPLGSGKLKLNNATVAYVVYQNADETLADALEAQPLSSEQAIDATRALARGLSELHANGYVHGGLAPEEVRAVGDRVEISTESIRHVNTAPRIEHNPAKYRAPESETQNLTIASDIWCLGATIFEALTKTAYQPVLREKAAELRHPFGTLLEGCLEPDPDKRLQLSDFEPILRSKAPPPKPKPVPAVTAEAPKAAAAGATNGTSGTVVAPEPSPSSEALTGKPEIGAASTTTPQLAPRAADAKTSTTAEIKPPVQSRVDRPPKPSHEPPKFEANNRRPLRQTAISDEPATGFSARRGWLYAVAAFIAIFAILWFVHARSNQNTVARNNTAASDKSAVPKPAPAWPTQTLSPDAKTPAPASEPPQPAPKTVHSAAPETGGRTIWRVVLYTYRREADAQKRANEIAAKRPDLHAEVFAPANSGPYLVVAGDGTTRDEAARIRSRAIREGMPHDSYIQNYSH
ncbi:MAG TPA: protein kinase [Bryobacteraceae bacterium]|nr:protein kinase [Bryobacteraceae bacterium]